MTHHGTWPRLQRPTPSIARNAHPLSRIQHRCPKPRETHHTASLNLTQAARRHLFVGQSHIKG
ncbi:hypothetical protein XF_1251 [Xylella fastidiosa 9a5c]|uniref:Uncharacterized protein n=1 Tax=Xylella fastidiosa (strain 9a5c) TaxID=160492 RepID=Q9PDX8_XYLFA|nr:hypothetical protein XF_1251 [Xylella fastidiosa 9a5c]